jgi:hypothetical protein
LSVHWKFDLNGNTLAEIDGSDPMRTHVSAALGYVIAQEFELRGKAVKCHTRLGNQSVKDLPNLAWITSCHAGPGWEDRYFTSLTMVGGRGLEPRTSCL